MNYLDSRTLYVARRKPILESCFFVLSHYWWSYNVFICVDYWEHSLMFSWKERLDSLEYIFSVSTKSYLQCIHYK